MLVEIEPHVFLSDIVGARCVRCLHESNINGILTVDSQPLDCTENKSCDKHSLETNNNQGRPVGCDKTTFIEIMDDLKTNLFEVLATCFEFMDDLVQQKCNVLVHCHAGVSRSVSIITSYLMKSQRLKFEDAFQKVKQAKPDVLPNPCFVYQLKLFEKMDFQYKDLEQSTLYKNLLVKFDQLQKLSLHEEQMNEFWKFPQEMSSPQDESVKKVVTYKCRSCRVLLFTSRDVSETHNNDPAAVSCTSLYFTDPLDWMKKLMKSDLQGKITCFKCNSKLGMFNWSGRTCSCGLWVTPSFQIQKSRVDHSFPK